MTAATEHEWLHRLSDYQSGGVSDAERAAVEEHMKTCSSCQEALAMYRRFYILLRSPLSLGAPSAAFTEDFPTVVTRATGPSGGGPRFQQPRRKLLAGIAAGLAAAIVVAGFLAALAARGQSPSVSATPVPHHTATTAPQPTDTVSVTPVATTTSAPTAFACANPAGSQLIYAYVRSDGYVYSVTGCNTPKQLTSAPNVFPKAWSPSNRYLAVTLGQGWPAADGVAVIDTQTGTIMQTGFMSDFGSSPDVGTTIRIFFGWLDDNSFLGAVAPLVNGPANTEAPGTSTLVRVDLHTGKQTTIGAIPGWVTQGSYGGEGNVRIVANGHYLFYAAYEGTTAYLHRFDLIAGGDTKLVPLGLYTNGGCSGTSVCGWSAGWDVSSDGSRVVYHNPGPTSAPSDTNIPADTPLLYANVDGSGAVKLFGGNVAEGLTVPVFSPDGRFVVATGSTYSGNKITTSQTGLAQLGGGYQIVSGHFEVWRGDSQAIILYPETGNAILYTLNDGVSHSLNEVSEGQYLWGN